MNSIVGVSSDGWSSLPLGGCEALAGASYSKGGAPSQASSKRGARCDILRARQLSGYGARVPSGKRRSLHVRDRVGRSVTRHRRSALVGKLDEAARWFTARRQDSGNWRMDTNGELGLIEAVRALDAVVVFDVGAHVGDWSEAALGALPAATVTSFEPIPAVAARCQERLARFGDRSRVVAAGLADSKGERAFFIDPQRTTVSGLARPSAAQSVQQVVLPFTTGDEYCAEAGVERIDLLKVDAEGADHLVLAGFRGLLNRGAVRVVQFEYGPWAMSTRYLLATHYDFFAEHGYQVGRLYAEGVEFRDHSTRFEDFRLANYVAVRRTDSEAIRAVSVS